MSGQLVRQVGQVSVFELLGSGDQDRIDSIFRLYVNLFPQYQHYVPRMRRRAEFGNEHRPGHIVHYWLIEVDGQPAGMRIFRYVRNRRCGLAHALAIAPKFRDQQVLGRRLAVYVIFESLEQVIQDAKLKLDPPPYGIANEVEPDRLMDHYRRNGLLQLPLKYSEPIFPPERSGRSRLEELSAIRFSKMHLGFLSNPEMAHEKFTHAMLSDFVLAFLVDHYGLPEDHPVVLEVLESIRI
jgi:hypothetical protein